MTITLHCRTISKGQGKGPALVCKSPMGFNFGVDVATGVITEGGHPLEGVCIKDTVLIFPYGKGSTGGSYVIYQLAKAGTGPSAIINESTETIIAVGAIMGGMPVVDMPDRNVFECIQTGDMVEVDANAGLVKVTKAEGGAM